MGGLPGGCRRFTSCPIQLVPLCRANCTANYCPALLPPPALRHRQPGMVCTPLSSCCASSFPAALQGVGDTFDLVPIGAWYGKGKRTGERHGAVAGNTVNAGLSAGVGEPAASLSTHPFTSSTVPRHVYGCHLLATCDPLTVHLPPHSHCVSALPSNRRVWLLPAGCLRPRRRGVPDHLQNRHRLQVRRGGGWGVAFALAGDTYVARGRGVSTHLQNRHRLEVGPNCGWDGTSWRGSAASLGWRSLSPPDLPP